MILCLITGFCSQWMSSITWMRLDLHRQQHITTLIVLLNVSGTLSVSLSIWPPPKTPMENFGASCCLLINTETPQSTKETRVHITLPLRYSIFSSLNKCVDDVLFIEIMMANEQKAESTQLLTNLLSIVNRLIFFAVALFVLAVPKWRLLCAELQTGHVQMPLRKYLYRRILWER